MAVETVTNQPAKAPVSGIVKTTLGATPTPGIQRMENTAPGEAILDAPTHSAQIKATSEFRAVLEQDIRTNVLNAPIEGTGIKTGGPASENIAEQKRSVAAFAQGQSENQTFAAAATASLSDITPNSSAGDVEASVRRETAVLANMKRKPVELPFAETTTPSSTVNAKPNPADRETDPKGILSSIPKGPAGPALAAPATGDKPAAAAPAATPAAKATAGAPSSPAQAAPVATAPEKVLTPVTAKVGTSSPASPATSVENRPTGFFAKKILPNTVIEPSFAQVAAANGLTPVQPKTGLASLPFNGAAHSSAATGQLLGITNQPATAMGDLGTSSALDAVKKREAEPVAAARQKPSRNNPSGMTLATSAAR